MIIQEMRQAQLKQVKSLLDACFGDSAWTMDALCSQLEKADSRCVVATEDDTVVGFLAFEQILDEGSIVEIAVLPEYRRRGIARSLIKSAIHSAEGLNVIYLEVRESNSSAIGLYESLGFEKLSVRKGYYDRPKEDAVVYRMTLSEKKQ